jgi:hypothetical protein
MVVEIGQRTYNFYVLDASAFKWVPVVTAALHYNLLPIGSMMVKLPKVCEVSRPPFTAGASPEVWNRRAQVADTDNNMSLLDLMRRIPLAQEYQERFIGGTNRR